MGRWMVFCGALLVLAGLIVMGLERMGVGLGRLPGDFLWRSRSGSTTVFFPLATCVVISVVLSLVLAIVARFRR